jgi:LAGLIDADG endonuclease
MLGHLSIWRYSLSVRSSRYGRYVSNKLTSAGNQQESLSSEEQRRWFLAGVIEGEGSVYVGIKTHATVPLGFFVQPGFSITQHHIRRSLLEMARDEFEAGTIYPKPGNASVLVYSIHSRPVLSGRVAPFLQKYMRFSARREDFRRFTLILDLFALGAHREAAGLARIVELAYAMNLNGKQRTRPLQDVLDRILRGHTPDALGLGDEMVRPSRRRGEPGGNGNDLATQLRS